MRALLLCNAALAVDAHPGPDPDRRRSRPGHRGGPPDIGAVRGGHLEDRAPGNRGGPVRGAAGRRAGRSALDRGHSAGRQAVGRLKELYHRVAKAVYEGLSGVVRAVRAGAGAALRAGRSLGAAGRAVQRASDALGPKLQDARRDGARALDPMHQRGQERDHGPSRGWLSGAKPAPPPPHPRIRWGYRNCGL